MVAASIRYNNPGAMWGNALATKWGALPKAVVLKDGLGQGNNIAVFPTKVQGACAQFALWHQSYCNLSLEAAIKKWSGGNSSVAYMTWLEKATGLNSESMIDASILAGPVGLKLIKAQAQWEAGQVYPLSDGDWAQAQGAVFRGVPAKLPPTTAQKKTASIVVAGTATTGAVVKAASSGHHWGVLVVIALVGIAAGVGAWFYFHHKG